MKIKKTVKQNLDSAIVSFFKNVSTSPFESDIYRIESIYNNDFKIYKSNDYFNKKQTLAVLLLNDQVKNIEQLDYVTDIIDDWLSNCLSTSSFFTITDIKNHLFDNRTIKDVRKFCKQFEDEIKKIMQDHFKQRFLIFPVMNFFKDSFSFGKVGYLSKNQTIMPIIKDKFSEGLEYVCSKLRYEMNNPMFEYADGFIFIKTYLGENFLSKSEDELKIFMTICLSTINKNPSSILCCLLDQFKKCVYFDDFNEHHYHEFKNPILPSIAKYQIETFDFDSVEKWFEVFKHLEDEKKERIERAVYLINNAFCREKYKKFSELCQGIDALFGINRKVEKTVNGNLKNVIKQYNGDQILFEKIDKLWALRNSLIHGSIKDIRDSDIYLEYKLKYLSCPEDDYLDLSLFCIKHSVHYFRSGYFLDFKNSYVKLDGKLKSYLKKKIKKFNDWIKSS